MIVGGATLDLVGCTSVPLLHLYMYVRLPARAPHRKVARTRLPVTQERYAKFKFKLLHKQQTTYTYYRKPIE